MSRSKTPPLSPVVLSEDTRDVGLGLVGRGVVSTSLEGGHEELVGVLAAEAARRAPSPLATLPEDVKDRLLRSVESADEVSSIFLKESHEQWIEELAVAIEGGDIGVIQGMLDARLALAEGALAEMLSGPRVLVDLDHLEEQLFGTK